MPAAMPMIIGLVTSDLKAVRSAARAVARVATPSITSARSLRMVLTVIITGRLMVMSTASAAAPSSP